VLLKTIIVAVDCSDTSEQLLTALTNLNLDSNETIIFTNILPSPESNYDLPLDQPQNIGESFYQEREEQLKSYQIKYPGSKIEILRGDPAEEIIRLANIYHADLIVIGSRGLKGFKRIFENSVSSQVVADAVCSVLVVRN
jgi:nucleotide-binding universal stress UspA family protein